MTHDRTGEIIDLDASSHNPDCRKGWLGDDPDGHPTPCLDCRPHLRAGTSRVNDCTPERNNTP